MSTITVTLRVVDVQSAVALREARGAGLERPDPGGEKSCRLAVGSADMLCLACYVISVCRWSSSAHSGGVRLCASVCCLRVGLFDVGDTNASVPVKQGTWSKRSLHSLTDT
jgi:hypothetical protein